MNRRAVLQAIAALVALPRSVFARAGTPVAVRTLTQAAAFGARETATLVALAEVVLPTSLSANDRRDVVSAFTRWFTNYRAGADMGHGYGASTLRQASPASPIAAYPEQFAALDSAAAARGAATFAALPAAARREVVEAALNTPKPVMRMPGQPTGASLIADFMGRYYNGADAWNLAYQAEINRDSCRTLDDSMNRPRAIRIG
jgi:hypothetical protein